MGKINKMKYSKGYKKRVNRYPKKCIWKNQSLTMHHWNLRIKISELQKISKRLSPKWIDFWNLVTDLNPRYCFLCGFYIPVIDREIYAEQPFKNGELVHNECFKKLMQIKHINDRINPDSELICHLDLGWGIQTKPICRTRVKNSPGEIRQHMMEKHGWHLIPELELKEILSDKKITEKEKIAYYKENPIQWFYDNQLIWKDFRNMHFLKPNGKAFPRPRDY